MSATGRPIGQPFGYTWIGYYTPEEVIGQQVSILVNLEPKALKGIESQGMILMAENADGSLAFVRPDKEVKNGSEIR